MPAQKKGAQSKASTSGGTKPARKPASRKAPKKPTRMVTTTGEVNDPVGAATAQAAPPKPVAKPKPDATLEELPAADEPRYECPIHGEVDGEVIVVDIQGNFPKMLNGKYCPICFFENCLGGVRRLRVK